MSKKRIKFGLISLLIVIGLMFTDSISVLAKDVSTENISINHIKASKILSDIDDYQKNYFENIKRNDVLLRLDNDKTLNKNRKDLDKLYKKVTKQISNKHYLKEYKNIKKRYAKCNEITDIGMSDFAERNYNDINNLLNEVYQEVKSKLSSDDFENLAKSEADWLKEVKDYENIFSSMDYGTIGKLVYYEYQINMTEFRTLLLMLYL